MYCVTFTLRRTVLRVVVAADDSRVLPEDYMRKMPKFDRGIGAFNDAEIPSARTRRVSRGSITPSSHKRAVE